MKVIASLIMSIALLMPLTAVSQQPVNASVSRAATVVPTPRSEWLGSFSGIVVSGNMHVRLIKNAAEEGPRILYDTKGELSPKFKAAVDKNGILRVDEPVDPKRTTVTEVTIWCNDIVSLTVVSADLTFENTVAGKMFDLDVSGGANVRASFDVADLAVDATGRSSIVVEGAARYMRLGISTAKFDGSRLQTVSSIVDASHTAEIRVSVSERLEALTATSAVVFYTGEPQILRRRVTMFGGDIAPLEN